MSRPASTWTCIHTDEYLPHRTESFDNAGPIGVDPRWERYQAFSDYLLDAFPTVYVFCSDISEDETLIFWWKAMLSLS